MGRYRALGAAIAIVALCGTTWATCVEGAMSAPMQQMACCKNGQHTCGPHASAADCCKKDGSRPSDSMTIAKLHQIDVPVRVLVAWVAVPDLASLTSFDRRVAHDSSPPGLSASPPPYIVFSSLLI